VLSAGPTPHTPLAKWTFTIRGAVDKPIPWTSDEFRALQNKRIMVDVHCVTKWPNSTTERSRPTSSTSFARAMGLELRSPIGGYFIGEESLGGPLFLVAGRADRFRRDGGERPRHARPSTRPHLDRALRGTGT
jgi:hypothetical protein